MGNRDSREKNGKINHVLLVGESRTAQDRENAREEWETVKTTHTQAQSAAEQVTVSAQPLHPQRTQTPSPVPEWDVGHLEAITGIIYNHSEVTTQKCRSQERQERWRDGERERGREAFKGLTWRRRMAERSRRDPGMAFPSIQLWWTARGGKLLTHPEQAGSFPRLCELLLGKFAAS